VVNSLALLLIMTVMGLVLKVKYTNLQISDEISYMQAKIAEQENSLKIYKAELSLLTTPKSLTTLYKAYYKISDVNLRTNIGQIKNVDKLASYFTMQQLSLNQISNE